MNYEPNASRSNLTVLPSAQVTKVILKKEGGVVTATGVEFLHDGKTYKAFATKEVVLSARCVAKKTQWDTLGAEQLTPLPAGL